ncbi:MAG: OmpA/MotB family protein [Candidatus Kapaibacteriota bacterium]
MRIKKSRENEEVSRDRYLITYADLITLLLGLFVILYASSKVDESQYKQVKEALNKAFKSNKGVLNGGEGVLDNKSNTPVPTFEIDTKSLDKLYSEANVTLNNYIKDGNLNIRYNGVELVLSLPESLLFSSGDIVVRKKGILVLDTITKVISKYEKLITIDGHTDSDPIKSNLKNNNNLVSNWQLSVFRALYVSDIMISKGLPKKNLAVRGFGDNRPLVENNNPTNKAKNRRVEISISELPLDVPSTKGYDKK